MSTCKWLTPMYAVAADILHSASSRDIATCKNFFNSSRLPRYTASSWQKFSYSLSRRKNIFFLVPDCMKACMKSSCNTTVLFCAAYAVKYSYDLVDAVGDHELLFASVICISLLRQFLALAYIGHQICLVQFSLSI